MCLNYNILNQLNKWTQKRTLNAQTLGLTTYQVATDKIFDSKYYQYKLSNLVTIITHRPSFSTIEF